jgi:hypothetical protein
VSSITGIWFFALPLALSVFIFADNVFRSGSSLESLPIGSAAVAASARLVLILLIPFGFGFGTNTGIWSKAISASLIFVSVAVYLLVQLQPRLMRSALSGFLLCYLAGVALMAPSHAGFYVNPQRQPQPLYLNRSVTLVGKGSPLILSDGFSEYIENARAALSRNGFVVGTPILDLSGQSPGLIYALEGRAVGQAWMIGGYKGSNQLGANAISKISCKDLHSSWLIIEPGGPRSLDLSILQKFGIDIKDSSRYEKVIAIDVPRGAGGYDIDRGQVIFRPVATSGANFRCSS